ncbi:GAF domain-containing protein [Pseudogemmatithrix spongiicola]|uniref:GAF domain-containing protein n=1 Tax=Pseudogemmatithrix spongiicola TaxID=3062599 RepID=A0AA49JXU0_9BACT|nr:GAF domain-containing protein [Gemmatimonadaceae bacterium 'strain 138']WKW13787.1 GAF domain-containing protein [Gemmatimonadaceae bacterium 'strain 318']
MGASPAEPRFGEADLSNCERELIHLSGSIQPHGVLLVLSEPRFVVVQLSANVDQMLGMAPDVLLGSPIEALGFAAAEQVRALAAEPSLVAPQPLRLVLETPRGRLSCSAMLHRPPAGGLILELEEIVVAARRRTTPALTQRLTQTVTRLSAAHSIPALADLVVRDMRDLIGYDRVMVYRFDADGHGEIIAEEKRDGLESFLHRHYPATDIPQRARELYLRNKVRLLVDARYVPVPLVPRENPLIGDDIDLSMAGLRSISPMHTQYLQNMGVTGTVVASLIHEGKLWGLISCHHYSAKYLPYDLRAAVELVAEVVSTRISALEHFAEAQAEVLVRRLEHRLIEATSTDGDWRRALFDTPRQLLQPVGATGAALLFDGEVETTGEVPSTPDLRALFAFLDQQDAQPLFACSSIAKLAPSLAAITPVAAGVLAVRLGGGPGEYLVWFRREQVQDVTWGGDPKKAVVFNAKMELSPRRSFAAWHELVRETSIPWTPRETAIARAIGQSLGDIVLQIRAVRVLIAEAQLDRMRRAVVGAAEPIVIADESGRVLLANDALAHLMGGPFRALETVQDFAQQFEQPQRVHELIERLRSDRRPWRGELRLARGDRSGTPVAMRADPIPQLHGGLFGFIFVINDLTAREAADHARERLQRAIYAAQRPTTVSELEAMQGPLAPDVQALVSAVWANAGVAVSEIADSADLVAIAPLLREVEAATRQAARLSTLLGRYASEDESAAS